MIRHRSRAAVACGASFVVIAAATALGGCDPPPTFQWESVAPAPTPRFEANGTALNGGLYVLGGFGSIYLNAVVRADRYDVAANTWRRIADLPAPVNHAAVAADTNRLWVIGGTVGSWPSFTTTDAVRRYNPSTNRWTTGPPLPAPRTSGAAAIVGGVLHYFGGVDAAGTDAADHWALDLADPRSWRPLAPLPVPRNHLGGAALGGAVYAVGGQFGGHELDGTRPEVHRYDPATDSWSAVAPLPEGRGHIMASTSAADGRIVVVGGALNGSKTTSSVVEYDPQANTWTSLPDLPASRESPVSALVAGRLVSSTGIGGGDASGEGSQATDETWAGTLPAR